VTHVEIGAATLLERERELMELGDALTGALAGSGRVVLIEAPAGLGKTSLLRVASQAAAEAGFTCLRARASLLERDFAYGCVRQLLEPAIAKASGTERQHLFEGAAALSMPLFAPTGGVRLLPSADVSFSMLHGLYWLLENLAAKTPVTIVVDDLHWSDAESLRFLNYLAPRFDGLPVAILASIRTGEIVAPDLARLAAAPETAVLRPGPLSVEATAALCELGLCGEVTEEFAAACREATGGNPFFLDALLREVSEQPAGTGFRDATRVSRIGPAAVAQAVLLRLSGAPAAATSLVRAVAVLGDGCSLVEAAALAQVAELDGARAADLLVALAILKPGKDLEFAHPIVREAVYADMGSHARAEAHACAARILSARGASEERVAAQIAGAEPTGDAERVALLCRVAADALVRGAPAAAVAWLTRALAEPPPAQSEAVVLFELGSAELRLSAPAAVDHLRAAVTRAREPRLLAAAVRQLANALTISGRAEQAVEALESAIDIVGPQERELALLLEAEVVTHAVRAGVEARASAVTRLRSHRDLVGVTPGERLVLASLACERARTCESASEAAGYLEEALAGGRLLREQQRDIVGPFYDLVLGLLAADKLDVAEVCLAQALADARARASIPAIARLTDFRGWVSFRRGDVAKAEGDARMALELDTTYGIALGRPFALGLLVEALIENGETEQAEEALDGSGLGKEIPPGLTTTLLAARGLLHFAQGRAQDACEDLLEYGRRDEFWGGANALASRWRSHAALALAALGDNERAFGMASDDLARARRWGAASGIGIALRAVALVEGGGASVDRLREAVRVLEGSPARLEHARALTDLGAALRRANRRAEARDALRSGLDLAQRCEARALAERARTELRIAGGRSGDRYATGLEQLTASERRVAELAAAGNSNPEIAQALFVTRKTVETHLGRVYRKLGVSGRMKLGTALAEPDRTADA
jgi:DNA-binding CsgD family transcriptional regulator